MTSDAQIEILLKVQDQMSKKLMEVEKTVSSLGTSVKAQTKVMDESFSGTMSSLIALGNVAQGFDNILSTATNTVIRLENAQDRLLNSQDRLDDAQRKLNKLVKEGKEGTEEYADAQREQERATRNLNIAQNNLERVQGQLVGTYINLGIQTLTIINSLPQLVGLYDKMARVAKSWGVAESFLLALKGPLGIALVAGAIIVAGYAAKTIMAADATEQLSSATKTTITQVDTLTNKMNEFKSMITGRSSEEIRLQRRVTENSIKLMDLEKEGQTLEAEGLRKDIERDESELRRLQLIKEGNSLALDAKVAETSEAQKTIDGFMSKSHEEQLQMISQFATEAVKLYQPVRQIQIDIANFDKDRRNYSTGTTSNYSVPFTNTTPLTPPPISFVPEARPDTWNQRPQNITLNVDGRKVAQALSWDTETKYTNNRQ